MVFSNNIFINQLGYQTFSTKYLITTIEGKHFQVVSDDGIKYKGNLAIYKSNDPATGETLYIGDFSGLKEPGEYRVVIDQELYSHSFNIGDSIYKEVLNSVVDSFYFQRCGTSLDRERVGEFERCSCHTGITDYHPELGIDGGKDVTGGWHDAGDYGRYITPGAVTVAFMLIGFENYPSKFENSNIIEEVRYELNWMLKMQETDKNNPMYGAVHYMINSRDYTWNTPENDDQKQYIMDYSSSSTADYAAVMACASRVFREIDREYSEILLNRAKIAWDFVSKREPYPTGGFKRPADVQTGGYAVIPGENDLSDKDKLWPAVELFLTTEDEEYHTVVKDLFKKVKLTGDLTWIDKTGFAELQYILSKSNKVDGFLKGQLQYRLIQSCDRYLDSHMECGFKTILTPRDYRWGSNGDLMAKTLQLIVCYLISQNEIFKDVALSQLNYILGLNIHNKSFIAGIGSDFVKNIHHASFENDGIEHSFKGMLTGGPNSYHSDNEELRDKALISNCPVGTPPGKCYVDDKDSFSSNENCIIYSAPLVSVAAFFA